VQQLLSALFNRWAGQPILVIGGGPSVNEDLPKLVAAGVKPACVISANEHGFKQKWFPIDLVVNVDKVHCLLHRPMEEILRPLGAPIVNRHSWADFRLADWPGIGNTGITSIAVAAALGANPVLVTGIDMWKGGRLYFHEKPVEVTRHRRQIRASVARRTREKARALVGFVKGANIRPLSGPLCEIYPKFNPAEVLPAPADIPYRAAMRKVTPVRVEVVHGFIFSGRDAVPPGRELALSPTEARDAKIVTKGRVVK
jgi:hypothetical protein